MCYRLNGGARVVFVHCARMPTANSQLIFWTKEVQTQVSWTCCHCANLFGNLTQGFRYHIVSFFLLQLFQMHSLQLQVHGAWNFIFLSHFFFIRSICVVYSRGHPYQCSAAICRLLSTFVLAVPTSAYFAATIGFEFGQTHARLWRTTIVGTVTQTYKLGFKACAMVSQIRNFHLDINYYLVAATRIPFDLFRSQKEQIKFRRQKKNGAYRGCGYYRKFACSVSTASNDPMEYRQRILMLKEKRCQSFFILASNFLAKEKETFQLCSCDLRASHSYSFAGDSIKYSYISIWFVEECATAAKKRCFQWVQFGNSRIAIRQSIWFLPFVFVSFEIERKKQIPERIYSIFESEA